MIQTYPLKNKKVKTVNGIVGLIRRSFSNLDSQSCRKIYTAIVLPASRVCPICMAPHLAKHIDMLENVQMRATKLVDGLSNIEYPDRLRRLNLPRLMWLRYLNTSPRVWNRNIVPVIPATKSPKTKTWISTQPTEPKDELRRIQPNGLYCRAVKLQNDLPRYIVNAQNIKILKNWLGNAWKDLPFKFDHKGTITSDS